MPISDKTSRSFQVGDRGSRKLPLPFAIFSILLFLFAAILFLVQNPLLNILLIVPLVGLLGLSAKQITGFATFGVIAMTLSLGVAFLNTQRLADQSAALYTACVSQMSGNAALIPDATKYSTCAERYLSPTLWRIKA